MAYANGTTRTRQLARRLSTALIVGGLALALVHPWVVVDVQIVTALLVAGNGALVFPTAENMNAARANAKA